MQRVIEVVPGLWVEPERLADELGHDPGEPFLLAGLAILERALVEAREDRWWHALPDRLCGHLEAECARAVRVVAIGARLQREHADYLYHLTHDPEGRRLDDELLERVRRPE